MANPEVLKLTPEQVTAFIKRMRLVVTDEQDFRIIQGSLATLGFMAQELKSKRTSIRRLTEMLFGESTEAIAKLFPPTTERTKPKPKGPKPGHGRTGANNYPGAERVKVPHERLKPGDECPECPNGRVYPIAQPAVMVRIVGLSPLQAKVIERERLRCNACGEVFTAKAPEGTGPEKFDASAAAMVALLKYGTGAPFYRLARLQANLGIPLPASTQWELVQKQAGLLDPVVDELARLAAQAEVVFNDDTTMKLIDRPDLRLDRKERKGVYTSGIVARIQSQGPGRARGIVLFRTGHHHAGENLAEILRSRSQDLPPPIQMCDALAANTKGPFETLVAHCLAHARRRFVEVVEDFPEECRHLLGALRDVYRHDSEAEAMTGPERLRHHQEHSGPVMDALKAWLEDQMEARKVEPNSGLGKAITYMLKHWIALTLFLREPGAPLDNNVCERALKRAILHRKNSLFYKSEEGARVGDVYMSLIHTAEVNEINPFEYLVALQRNHALAEENPEEWMPWSYQATLKGLESL
ncbi:MAG: IS66 family transposase [Holophaga sp.]